MKEKNNPRKAIKNPQYPNPSIAEALCEIHFAEASNNFEKIIIELKKTFKDLYDPPEKKKIKQYHAQIDDIGVSVEEKPIDFWVFKHKKRNQLIQVFPHMISVNELKNYPGWELFSTDLSFAWKAVKKSFSISNIKHIGLRYINVIPRENEEEPLSQWLQPNRYYPDGILDSTTGFVSRSEFSMGESKRLIVTIAETKQTGLEKGFIFDIDSVIQINKNIAWKEILQKINSLHDLISDVFLSSIAKKYETFLKEEKL